MGVRPEAKHARRDPCAFAARQGRAVRILVIEDESRAATFLQIGLEATGFAVETCMDGAAGMETALLGRHDMVLLDVALPGRDGWDILAEMRRREIHTPVLMLTAHDAVEHRVKGLSLGADDYLVKPFAFSELVARMRSILRRCNQAAGEIERFEDLVLDHTKHFATRNGQSLDLTMMEFELLHLLVRHQREVLSRAYISERVWGMSFDGESNAIEVMMRRLRRKVDEPFERKLIHTVRGLGYVVR